MPLEKYKRKRDFRKTPEPRGGGGKQRAGRRYVIQKHDASRLHYDLRLQVGDVLASWAVPKGPSVDPADKRLAVHVEDHPLEYGDFEGVIPEGEYGGGTVMLWDEGTWATEEGDPAKALKRGKLSFTLKGRRLRGGWTLARMRTGREGEEDRDNWLLIKQDDEEAAPGKGDSVLERESTSVKTGRSLEEIAGDEGGGAKGRRRRRSNGKRGLPPKPAKGRTPRGVSEVPGARKAPMPRVVSPQLCTLTDRAPPGDDWIHEIKFDGYRLLCERRKSGVRLMTRSGKDWTAKFGPLAEAMAALPVETAIIDGEATILDPRGHSSFQRLQNAIKARAFGELVYFAFDLLYVDGYDLLRAPLLERKRLLHELVPETSRGLIRYSDHVVGAGEAVRQNACELALEGIISKRADAPYVQTRSRTWLKVKCSRRQEFVVIGWSPPSGSRRHFGSLLLGAYDADGRLMYTGRVGTGFDEATLRDVKGRLKAIEQKACPADDGPAPAERRGAHWVRPRLVAEIEFTEWTDDGRLRHPSFQGLREDKQAKNVRVERPQPVEEVAMENGKPATRKKGHPGASPRVSRPARRPGADTATVAGVRVTSPDRVLYPDQGLTKLDLARYYESVADRILPFIAGRPLSTVRCPQGRQGHCFFQKHLRETFDDPVRAIRVREKSGAADYIAVDSAEGLVTLVQFGVLEIHPWGSTEEHLERPDVLTFDLDPGEGAGFDAVKEGARRVREVLKEAGLGAFLKATGGKGLHVVVPLEPEVEWEPAKAFCADVARRLVAEEPGRYIAKASKAERRGKVFVDYLRNARGATSIAPYSTRARAGAPVAAPLRWDELAALEAGDKYSVANLARRLARLRRDPWEGMEDARVSLAEVVGARGGKRGAHPRRR